MNGNDGTPEGDVGGYSEAGKPTRSESAPRYRNWFVAEFTLIRRSYALEKVS